MLTGHNRFLTDNFRKSCLLLAAVLLLMTAAGYCCVDVTAYDGTETSTVSVIRGTSLGRALSAMGMDLRFSDTTSIPVTVKVFEDTQVTILRDAQNNPDFSSLASIAGTVLSDNSEFYVVMKAKEEEIRRRREQLQRYVVNAVINDDGTLTAGGRTYEITDMMTMEATAYCPCEICCGIYSSGYTADGSRATQGHTVATSSAYPFGTLFYIPYFDNIFEVEDRGGAIQGNRIDIYYDTHDQALGFGRRDITVYVITPYISGE